MLWSKPREGCSLRNSVICLAALWLFLPFVAFPAGAAEANQNGEVTATTIELPFKSHDGYEMFGKLTLPNTSARHPVVIYVQTAEGMTVDMKRGNGRGGTFNYFDLYRQRLPQMNVAFFSYEGRGIKMGDKPNRYETIDWDVYNTSTLENKVRDAMTAVRIVQKHANIDPSRVFLIGTSEGTLLAAETASRLGTEIKGAILYAVMSSTMRDTFKYIVTDGAFLIWRIVFDADKDGRISKNEFLADPRKFRERALKNASFETFDKDRDGLFTVEELRAMPNALRDAVDNENYEVLNNWGKSSAAVSIPKDWFKDHFAHPPIWTFLSQLNMPVGLFHGDRDTNTPIEGVRMLESQAKSAGKSSMEFHYFEGLDHSLGLGGYFATGNLPAGHRAIFEYIKRQTASETEDAIAKFLSTKKTETEDAQASGSEVVDLDGDGKPEIALLWTILGPTYFHSTLTVFSKKPAGYAEIASLQITGEATFAGVKNGVILIDQKLLAKNDPRCCPSIKKQGKYRWQGTKILEVRR